MARRFKKQSDAVAAELPLEERVEAFYGNLVKKHGLSTSDASFCDETVNIDGVMENGRSQQGYICCLVPAGILNMSEAVIHAISWSSTHIKRVCRAT